MRTAAAAAAATAAAAAAAAVAAAAASASRIAAKGMMVGCSMALPTISDYKGALVKYGRTLHRQNRDPPTPLFASRDFSEARCEPWNLGIHYRGVQWEGGAVDGGSII